MPMYVYRCQNCGEQFEKMMRFSESDRLPECPECHSAETQKQVTTFAATGASASTSYGGSSCGSSGRFT